MTGPEHYQKAQELLEAAADLENGIGSGGDSDDLYRATLSDRLSAQAQVHATLALAAATAAGTGDFIATDWTQAGAW